MLVVTGAARGVPLLLLLLLLVLTSGCGSGSTAVSSATTATGAYTAEVTQLSEDPAVAWIPPGAEVDVVRFRDGCVDGFDPITPEYVRSFKFAGPRDVDDITDGFRLQFAEAGWTSVLDTPSVENTGGPNGISLSYTKSFDGWSAVARVYVSDPTDERAGGLSTSVTASIDPIPCEDEP